MTGLIMVSQYNATASELLEMSLTPQRQKFSKSYKALMELLKPNN